MSDLEWSQRKSKSSSKKTSKFNCFSKCKTSDFERTGWKLKVSKIFHFQVFPTQVWKNSEWTLWMSGCIIFDCLCDSRKIFETNSKHILVVGCEDRLWFFAPIL